MSFFLHHPEVVKLDMSGSLSSYISVILSAPQSKPLIINSHFAIEFYLTKHARISCKIKTATAQGEPR